MDSDPNVYSAPPKLFAPVGALAALVASIVLIAMGHVILGSIVLGLAVLALLFLMQELAAGSTRFVSGGYDRARALSGFAGASVRTWSRTGGRVARLRLESHRLLRERRQTQLELGAAAYAGDEHGMERLIAQLHSIDEELTACIRETERAIQEARSHVARERLAVVPTEVRRGG